MSPMPRVKGCYPVSEGVSVFVCQGYIPVLREVPTFITSPLNTRPNRSPATTCFRSAVLNREVICPVPCVRPCVQTLFPAHVESALCVTE